LVDVVNYLKTTTSAFG